MSNPFEQVDSGKTMAEMWQGFAAIVLPFAPEGTIQHDEMRKAFYSGALCLFNWFMVQLDEGVEVTDNDLSRVERMSNEIQSFLKKGK